MDKPNNINDFNDFINSEEYDKFLEILQTGNEDDINILLRNQQTNIIPLEHNLESTPIESHTIINKSIDNESKDKIKQNESKDKIKHDESKDKIKQNESKDKIKQNSYSLNLNEDKIAKMEKRNSKKRCGECNTKLKIIDFTCKCTIIFCNKHKFPENHLCNFDHKKRSREQIKSKNPLVVANKVPNM